MKPIAAIAIVACLITAGCGYGLPPRHRAEIRRAREDFRRARQEAREGMHRARREFQRDLRDARDEFRRKSRDARQDFRDDFGRW
jgi:hypothetical protein